MWKKPCHPFFTGVLSGECHTMPKLATTGNVAFQIGGMPIHAFFYINIDEQAQSKRKLHGVA